MSNVKQKYLRDEDNEIFSPIISEDSVKGDLPIYFVRSWACFRIESATDIIIYASGNCKRIRASNTENESTGFVYEFETLFPEQFSYAVSITGDTPNTTLESVTVFGYYPDRFAFEIKSIKQYVDKKTMTNAYAMTGSIIVVG